MSTRKEIYAAAFARVSRLSWVRHSSKRIKTWDDVPPNQQPAIFIKQKGESARYKKGVPSIWTLRADLWIYAQIPDSATVPSDILNPYLDAIEAAYAPDNASANECTLGGIVSHCRISNIQIDDGALDKQAVLIISLEMLVA